MVDATEQAQKRAQIVRALRAFGSAQTELGRLFARSKQMHTTDAAAIVEILTAEDHGQPLTPAGLAKRIGLTTGATSTLLNRLESAGHIRRSREHRDRRVVTLHSTPDIHAAADAFFAPLAGHLDAALSQYSTDQLDLVTEVVARLQATMAAHLPTAKSVRA